ncbi:MAG: class I SAM-dependent methyltransferase [Magnetococcus sp. MYC-9]
MHKLLETILACPGCHGRLSRQAEALCCTQDHCRASPRRWPIVRGVPVLFDESKSFFRISDGVANPGAQGRSLWWRRLSRIWYTRPKIGRNVAAERNYQHLGRLLHGVQDAVVLVVGCGDEGIGIHRLHTLPNVTLVNLDIRWTASVHLMADAQQLPFADETFDAVVLQGVLEHVLDIFQVETEVFRTLKAEGVVYCELPFLQPNHGGAFDLTRLTWTGHRRFWRRFIQLDAGACCGPGMALATMVQQFARALLPFRSWRIFSDWLVDWLFWWLKYLDGRLTKHAAGLDGASAFYFLGRKSDQVLSDRELIAAYRGGQ